MALNEEKEEVQSTKKTLESVNSKLKDSNECFEAQIHELCKQHMIDKKILERKLWRTSAVGCSVGFLICAPWAWACWIRYAWIKGTPLIRQFKSP
ncbi:hypothetical protein K469DRAFT_700631 [Zopfia rhizophila CBS 207.26]|uniref:Uncharacterized protein n=1 Tax=Zopfia rhizophila CBS 207.26 TaxID=1314779 RepID=A0A6A6EDX8_9PEZI|nr:hypothetical protein K469DRAFT_700631 [Zopfia rhizophila CBS 207.26]